MNDPLVNILNIISMGFLSGTIVLLVLSKRKKPGLFIGNRFFVISFTLLLFVTITNLFEHFSITDYFDTYEDSLELLFIPFMIFALYATKVTYENDRRIQAEHLNSKILGTSPALTFIFNLAKARFTFLSGQAILNTEEGIFRKNEADTVFRRYLSVETLNNILNHFNNIKTFKSSEFPFLFEFDLKAGDRNPLRLFQAFNTVFKYDASNKPLEIVGVAIDISEKQKAEEELVKYKNHLENLVLERTQELEASNSELITINEQLHSTNEEFRVLNEISKRQSHKIESLNSNLLDQNLKLENTNQELVHKQKELQDAMNRLAEMQEQLIHSEKLSSLGVLMAGIAHEINNPVNYISNGLVGLKKAIKQIEVFTGDILNSDEENICQKIKESFGSNKIEDNLKAIGIISGHIQTGVDRILAIVLSLKQYTRSGEEIFESTNINKIIDSVLVMLSHEYKHRIEITKEYGSLPLIECQSGKINQVIMNILSNAIQAITEKGNIWVSTKQNTEKEIVEIIIKDDGPGIPATLRNKIFDPFFTTKEAGKGTGLGLSISYDIIQAHNGKIACQNNQNGGASFIITLPINQ